MFNFNGAKVIFNVEYVIKHPGENTSCCRIDLIQECIQEDLSKSEISNVKLSCDREQQQELILKFRKKQKTKGKKRQK